MEETHLPPEQNIFDADSWAELHSILGHLPEAVLINVWADAAASYGEREAVVLCKTVADRFGNIDFRLLPRRTNYPYYPVIGFMGVEDGQEIDYGVRIIGLPTGYQMTSLVTAIQAVSFKGATLEPITRIKLHKLAEETNIELMTSAENEGGPIMAKIVFGLAVASTRIRSYLIMSDFFPEANLRYSISTVPHTVINGRVHIEGVVEEDLMLEHLAQAVGGG
jgi:alkyl hydroperoxide reductase subunit AhpF